MEKGFESWFQNQRIDWPSSNLIPSSVPFGLLHRINVPQSGNVFSSNVDPVNPPVFALRKPEEPSGWFHGFPYQGFTPAVNSIQKEQLPPQGVQIQKKFLVFDQSNDRTTLIYSSNPMQYQYHLSKPQPVYDPRNETSFTEKHEDVHSSSSFHEDTEELRALLYSDDDDIDYSENEEEQSTGHSPSTMIGFEFDRHDAEEVASSMSCRKRRKLDTGGYDVLSLEDTASSGKSGVNCSDDQAEVSVCGGGCVAGNGVTDVESETSPARKDKVRETISILQNLIPGGKNGKDAMVILDEAINYLRVLKVKAKALGLDVDSL